MAIHGAATLQVKRSMLTLLSLLVGERRSLRAKGEFRFLILRRWYLDHIAHQHKIQRLRC